jgi:cytochrome b involved in lipid metabolism
MDEVRQHDSPSDGWLVLHGKVYDVTRFIDEHPGGEVIADYLGCDATEQFDVEFEHSNDAREMLSQYFIGTIKE